MPKPPPTELPVALPPRLLSELVRREKLMICLDYDGTLSEIAPLPSEAQPVSLAAETLAGLARYRERVAIAIVSGRDIDTVSALLGLSDGLWFIGTHGLQIGDPEGRRRQVSGVEAFAPELERARRWLKRNVPADRGFVLEDKRVAIALHYRQAEAEEASSLRTELREFFAHECPRLTILTGKMIDEVLPGGIGGKGAAVRDLIESIGQSEHATAYFGDDATDEDAFFELRNGGVTVLVGASRPTWARYQVNGPSSVVARLRAMLGEIQSVSA